MVKKLSMCLTICMLAMCGCKDAGVKLEDENLIKVDITQPEQNLKMSDLFSSINYVKLETTEACLIKEINKIINLDGNLLVVDLENTSLLLFAGDGRFIKAIGGKGSGPGEFSGIEDVTIDKAGKRIFVWDARTHRILTYDFEGKYVENKQIDFSAEEMEYLGDDKLVFYCDYKSNKNYVKDDSRPNVMIYDLKNGQTIPFQYVDSRIEMQEMTAPFSALSFSGNGNVYCLQALSNDILMLDKAGISRTLTLYFGEEDMERRQAYAKRLEEEQLSADDVMMGGSSEPKHLIVFSIVNTDDFLFITAWDRRESMTMYQIAYSPESGRCIFGKKEKGMPLECDMEGSMPFQYYSADGNKLYGSVMPIQILSMEETDSEVLKQLKENLQEDDNPIVLIAETKPL